MPTQFHAQVLTILSLWLLIGLLDVVNGSCECHPTDPRIYFYRLNDDRDQAPSKGVCPENHKCHPVGLGTDCCRPVSRSDAGNVSPSGTSPPSYLTGMSIYDAMKEAASKQGHDRQGSPFQPDDSPFDSPTVSPSTSRRNVSPASRDKVKSPFWEGAKRFFAMFQPKETQPPPPEHAATVNAVSPASNVNSVAHKPQVRESLRTPTVAQSQSYNDQTPRQVYPLTTSMIAKKGKLQRTLSGNIFPDYYNRLTRSQSERLLPTFRRQPFAVKRSQVLLARRRIEKFVKSQRPASWSVLT